MSVNPHLKSEGCGGGGASGWGRGNKKKDYKTKLLRNYSGFIVDI